MAKISPNLQHLTDELPADKRKDIEEAIASSPHLRQTMTEAVNAGTLEHIRMGVPGANEGGHYNDDKRAIYLSPDTFTDPILKSRPEMRLDAITSTLGHETGHALYAEKARKELYFTTSSITDGVRVAGPGGEFDATGLVGAFIRDARRNEAQAEIHGWNALASRLEHTQGGPSSRRDILERANPSTNCVNGPPEKARLASGIVLDADMYMSDTRLPKAGPINLEPVAQCHFDKSGASLGAGGAADYTNYYGAYLVQQLADDTRHWVNPPTIRLDMEKLGLDKAQLESTGLRLGNDGFSFVDSSQGKDKPMTLRSSGSGIHGTPDDIALAVNDVRTRDSARETPAPVIAPRTVGLPASGGRDAENASEREPEHPARIEVQPAALATTAPDPALAHRAATRDERDDEPQPRTEPDPSQAANSEPAQSAPLLMTQPAHPANAMYTQALSRIERGDVMPTGLLTQEEKSTLAAGVVAQFLAEDKFATRVDGLCASRHNPSSLGLPGTLIPVQGDPTTDYCRRASIDATQALQIPLEQSSTVAQTIVQAREQALALELVKEQARKEQQEQDGTKGPTMRIGPRTQSPSMGPQGDGGGDGGGGE